MTNDAIYPLKFEPVFKEKIWGDTRLRQFFGRPLPAGKLVGESWEICDRPADQSHAVNGPFKGRSLHEIMAQMGTSLVGNTFKNTPSRFPLLMKLIDAGDDLSLQVHPPDEYARRRHAQDPGKTEAWYVLHAEKDAVIYCGIRDDTALETFRKSLESGQVKHHLNIFKTGPGSFFFIPAGTVHAIGAGNVIVEIQENSDITYRLSDWGRNRPGDAARALHLNEGFDVLELRSPFRHFGAPRTVSSTLLVRCPYFVIREETMQSERIIDVDPKSFEVLIFVHGTGTINDVAFQKGDFLLLPAAIGAVNLRSRDAVRVLRVTAA